MEFRRAANSLLDRDGPWTNSEFRCQPLSSDRKDLDWRRCLPAVAALSLQHDGHRALKPGRKLTRLRLYSPLGAGSTSAEDGRQPFGAGPHYFGLHGTEGKLRKLVRDVEFCPLATLIAQLTPTEAGRNDLSALRSTENKGFDNLHGLDKPVALPRQFV